MALEFIITLLISFVSYIVGIIAFVTAILLLIVINVALFLAIEKQEKILGKNINLQKLLMMDE